MRHSLGIFIIAVICAVLVPFSALYARPADPTFFEQVFEWVGDIFTFGDIARAERELEKAEAVLDDLEVLGEHADKAIRMRAATRYLAYIEDAERHFTQAQGNKKDISKLAGAVASLYSDGLKIIASTSPAVFGKTERYKEKMRNSITAALLPIEEVVFCSEEYVPVCGEDGATYENKCFAEDAGVRISHDGVCTPSPPPSTPAPKREEIFCIALYEPVCGVDETTYGNACLLKKAGVTLLHEGECVPPSPPSPLTPEEATGPAPDIALSNFSLYGSAFYAGDLQSISVSVLNSGDRATEEDVSTRSVVDLGSDGKDNLSFAEQIVGPLAPGESKTIIWRKAFVLKTGEHSISVCTDTSDAVKEKDEKNNCLSESFTVKDKKIRSDLYVEDVSFNSHKLVFGDAVVFSVTVKNIGKGDTELSHTVLRLDAGNDKGIDVVLENIETRVLYSGETKTLTWKPWIAADVGYYRIEACADAGYIVSESNENNNCMSKIFQVQPALEGAVE